MRVTNQITNEIANRSGIPVNQNSVLNSDSSTGNSLLDALNKSGKNSSDPSSTENYKKLEQAAEQLAQKAKIFTDEEEDSIFEKAKESGDYSEICEYAGELADRYNETIQALKSASGPLNDYYRQMMEENTEENKEALSAIGISISWDGSLSLDRDKMKNADLESIEKVLGASGTFSSRTAFIASRISDNAEVNAASASSRYDSLGNAYTAGTGKFDFWG